MAEQTIQYAPNVRKTPEEKEAVKKAANTRLYNQNIEDRRLRARQYYNEHREEVLLKKKLSRQYKKEVKNREDEKASETVVN